MKQYYSYLQYVIRHKYYVMKACFEYGLPLRGILHDMSKFSLKEFIPYANYFYNKDGSKKELKRDSTGYYKPYDTGDLKFDTAWLVHQNRNPHHWQYWLLKKDDGGDAVLEMPVKYINEMLCDWIGAGAAQGYKTNTYKWYEANKNKMIFGKKTREIIEFYVELLECNKGMLKYYMHNKSRNPIVSSL